MAQIGYPLKWIDADLSRAPRERIHQKMDPEDAAWLASGSSTPLRQVSKFS